MNQNHQVFTFTFLNQVTKVLGCKSTIYLTICWHCKLVDRCLVILQTSVLWVANRLAQLLTAMSKVTTISERAVITISNRFAEFGLVAMVGNQWTQLVVAMSKATTVSKMAGTELFPMAAQLSLEPLLVANLQFKWHLLIHPSKILLRPPSSHY